VEEPRPAGGVLGGGDLQIPADPVLPDPGDRARQRGPGPQSDHRTALTVADGLGRRGVQAGAFPACEIATACGVQAFVDLGVDQRGPDSGAGICRVAAHCQTLRP